MKKQYFILIIFILMAVVFMAIYFFKINNITGLSVLNSKNSSEQKNNFPDYGSCFQLPDGRLVCLIATNISLNSSEIFELNGSIDLNKTLKEKKEKKEKEEKPKKNNPPKIKLINPTNELNISINTTLENITIKNISLNCSPSC